MISLDPTSPVPPYEQVREGLAALIRTGAIAGGHRLPSIRQLAGDLRIAPGTVARAYSELESAGLIESSRARGTRVLPGQGADARLTAAAVRYVEAMRGHGVELADALAAVRAAWSPAPPPVTGETGRSGE